MQWNQVQYLEDAAEEKRDFELQDKMRQGAKDNVGIGECCLMCIGGCMLHFVIYKDQIPYSRRQDISYDL